MKAGARMIAPALAALAMTLNAAGEDRLAALKAQRAEREREAAAEDNAREVAAAMRAEADALEAERLKAWAREDAKARAEMQAVGGSLSAALKIRAAHADAEWVSGAELLAAWKENGLAAELRFAGRPVIVSGRYEGAKRSPLLRDPYVLVDGVHCYLKEASTAAKLREGDAVAVLGMGTARAGMVEGCEVVWMGARGRR